MGFGCKLAHWSEKDCAVKFSWKGIFLESNFIGHKSIFIAFLEQIYIIVLPKQQVLPHKKDGNISNYGLYWLRKGANMQYANIVEKTMPCVFFQKW